MQCLQHPTLNVNAHNLSSQFIQEVSLLANDISRNRISDWSEIQKILKIATKEKCPDLLELGNQLVETLESDQGFAVVKDLPFRFYERPVLDYLYLSLCLCLGELTVHSNSKNVIWEVTPRSLPSGRKLTFSELNSKAPLHNDSAFRDIPEKYFGLLAVTTAKQGGNSVIVRVDELIQSLKKSPSGAQCLTILRNQDFPFHVPPAFMRDPSQSNIVLAPVIADSPLIRFRLDTIQAGFKCRPELATPERLWAIDYFNGFINSYPDQLEFKLNNGDIIFVNNHKLLHGRTRFTGKDRLLLRVRIDKNAND